MCVASKASRSGVCRFQSHLCWVFSDNAVFFFECVCFKFPCVHFGTFSNVFVLKEVMCVLILVCFLNELDFFNVKCL